jgi:hypothetical protein
MELLLVLTWLAFLGYLAKTSTGTIQMHLLLIWLFMFGTGLWALGRLILSYLPA